MVSSSTMLYWQNIDQICPQIHYLSDQEQERLCRLSPIQGERFLRSRTFLRRVLGRYLQIQPRSVPIIHTPNGKPILEGHSLYFNLSHSGNLIVIALNDRYPVGIDLEQIKPRSFLNLVDRYFAPFEQKWFHNLPDRQCLSLLFYRSWVCKEAYGKLLDIPLLKALRELDTIPLLEDKTKTISKETIVVFQEGKIPGFRYALAHRTF